MSAREAFPNNLADPSQHEGAASMASETVTVLSDAAEGVFELAIRARNERAARPIMRAVKGPSRIRPTTKIKGWFRCHEMTYGPIDIFHPKDEGGFSDDPVFVMPHLAEELRREGSHFENAIREFWGYLVYTRGGALFLVLIPLPDPETGRHHSATEQKLDALADSRTKWKRLDWNKLRREFDDYESEEPLEEPEWPEDVSELAILKRAFGERNVIKDSNDPILAKFRGRT